MSNPDYPTEYPPHWLQPEDDANPRDSGRVNGDWVAPARPTPAQLSARQIRPLPDNTWEIDGPDFEASLKINMPARVETEAAALEVYHSLAAPDA